MSGIYVFQRFTLMSFWPISVQIVPLKVSKPLFSAIPSLNKPLHFPTHLHSSTIDMEELGLGRCEGQPCIPHRHIRQCRVRTSHEVELILNLSHHAEIGAGTGVIVEGHEDVEEDCGFEGEDLVQVALFVRQMEHGG